MTSKTVSATQPYWADSATLPRFSKLDRDEEADVVIVGGGITGLTAAYLLTLDGLRVVLLERVRCGQIDTGHTTAHLTMVTDERLSVLVQRFGRDHAQAAWEAGLAAIGQIDSIAADLALDCEFAWVPGYMHAPMMQPCGDGERASLRDEAWLAAEMGFDASFVEEVPFARRPGVRFDGQARIHPRKYLAGLARAVTDRGGMIFEHSAVDSFGADPHSVNANGHRVVCRDIVLATHTPLMGNTGVLDAALFQTKLSLYTSYVLGGRVKKGVIPDALYWDTASPYHYLRLEPHRDHDFVIFGGEDHKTGQSADTGACFKKLEKTLASLIGPIEITHRWSGQVIETADGLPFIGETAPRQFAGTGYAGNGFTFGTLAGMMAADRIAGRPNPWQRLFDPSRKTVGGLWNYVKENADYPYYMMRDRFVGAEGRSLRAVPRGSGKVLTLDGREVAVSRDDRGVVTQRAAACTHMGCLVEWNGAERTWDCPCHGSRFKPDGRVIAGPAESELEK